MELFRPIGRGSIGRAEPTSFHSRDELRRAGGISLQLLRALVAFLYGLVAVLTIVFLVLVADRLPALLHSQREPSGELAAGDEAKSVTGENSSTSQAGMANSQPDGTGRSDGNTHSRNTGLQPSAASNPSTTDNRVSLNVGPAGAQSSGQVLGVESETVSTSPTLSAGETQLPTVGNPGSASISAELVPLFEKARQALESQATDSARRVLTEAQAKATTRADQEKAHRWFQLCDKLDEFWRLMSQVVGRLEPLTPIFIGEFEALVVEASPESLTIRAAGQNRTYRLREIPPALVSRLAEQPLARNPHGKVVLATYLAIVPRGDKELSRKLLLEAMAAGVDPGDFVLELAAFFDPGTLSTFIEADAPGARQAAIAKFADPAASTGPVGTVADNTSAQLPPASASQASTDEEGDPWKEEREAATTPAAKARLARKLLESARKQKQPIDLRLRWVDEARQLAVEAGEVALVLACIEFQSQYRRLDRWLEVIAAFDEMATSTDIAVHREIAPAAIKLAAEATKERRFREADRLLDIALESARKCGSRTLIQEALTGKKILEAQRR